jgi:anti-sigma-K factor RskA
VEHVDELIAAHALHALDPDDEARVESHVAGCSECRAKLREMETVAGALAYASPRVTPPPELRTRVLASVRPVTSAAPAPTSPAPAAAAPVRARRRTGWWPRLAMVATPALAAAALALGIWNLSLRDQLNSTRHQFASGVTVNLPGIGNAVASGSGNVTLYTSAPAIPAGKTYEAWVITGTTARPAGLFGAGSGRLTLTRRVHSGDVIAVTVEPAGGRPQPTTTPVAVGHVTSV